MGSISASPVQAGPFRDLQGYLKGWLMRLDWAEISVQIPDISSLDGPSFGIYRLVCGT